jgi:hypothetical protein
MNSRIVVWINAGVFLDIGMSLLDTVRRVSSWVCKGHVLLEDQATANRTRYIDRSQPKEYTSRLDN